MTFIDKDAFKLPLPQAGQGWGGEKSIPLGMEPQFRLSILLGRCLGLSVSDSQNNLPSPSPLRCLTSSHPPSWDHGNPQDLIVEVEKWDPQSSSTPHHPLPSPNQSHGTALNSHLLFTPSIL